MKRLLLALASLLGIAALAIAITFAWGWRRLHTPYRAYDGAQHRLTIMSGSRADEILDRLESEGLIASSWWARLYLVRVLDDPDLKAGEYEFNTALTTPEVLAKLVRGEVSTHPVTVIEGLTLEETASVLAAAGFGELQALLTAMRSPALIADLDDEAANLEGYLFPDTYHFARGTSESAIVAAMVDNFRRRFAHRIEALTASGEPLRPVVTLASIVEKESQLDAERPLIAGVYANRLRVGMLLGADPTVIFALKQEGVWDGNIRRQDLRIDSPYNSYLFPGLPPGPICSAGLASLEAAAEPAETSYFYFVSRNDGSHAFAETLTQHNRNVEQWQRKYWRDRWARERRERARAQAGTSDGK